MAWTVVLMHVLDLSGYGAGSLAWLKPILAGDAAVNVFIVLSGFVVTHLLLVRNEPYAPYFARRAARIIPIYYVCLLLALLVLPAQVQMYTHPWVEYHTIWARKFAAFWIRPAQNLMLHLTLLHGVIPDNLLRAGSWAILGPAWSLSLEWQFYLVAPALLWLLRAGRAVAVGIVIALLAGSYALHEQSAWRWEWPSFLPLSIHLFLAGILCRYHFHTLSRWPRWTLPVTGFIAAALLGEYRFELLVWTVFLTGAVLEARPIEAARGLPALAAKVLARVTRNRLAISLGRCSYSTYLVHIPLFAAMTWLGAHALGLSGQGATAAILLLSLPALALLSQILYNFIESPFIRLGARVNVLATQ